MKQKTTIKPDPQRLLPKKFGKYFWEYHGIALTMEQDAVLITERILNFGNSESIKWLMSNITQDFLKEVVSHNRRLDNKTRTYWNTILHD